MGPRDLGLAQPLQQRRITSGSCDCLHLGAMCACVRHSHVRVCVRDGVFVSGMRVLFADLWGEREGFTHQHFPSRATHEGPTLLWDPACSLWHRVKQQNNERSEKLCEGSPRRVLRLLTSSPGRAEISRETIGNVGIAPRSPQQEVILHQPIN